MLIWGAVTDVFTDKLQRGGRKATPSALTNKDVCDADIKEGVYI